MLWLDSMNTLRVPCAVQLLSLGLWAGAPTNPSAIVGDWRTKGGESVVHIERTGAEFHGRILWLKEPLDKQGKAKLDIHNPDPKLTTRPILGRPLLHGFRFDGTDSWSDGRIYDPKHGKEYHCTMILDGTKLKVHGYVGISLLGSTEVWERAESN